MGSAALERAILSVQKQTYPCKHYIFIESSQTPQQADNFFKNFANLVVTFLPIEGETENNINHIIPLIVEEDVVYYLDENHWLETNYIEKEVKTLVKNKMGRAYSLSNFTDLKSWCGKLIWK